MCKFCYNIGEENSKKNIVWNVRSCFVEQNVEDYNELPAEWDGKHRLIESEFFKLVPRKNKGNIHITIEYRMETNDKLIISPFSNNVIWYFCPFCGRKISKDNEAQKCEFEFGFEIEDEDYGNKDLY